jgi:hypothetical protein
MALCANRVLTRRSKKLVGHLVGAVMRGRDVEGQPADGTLAARSSATISACRWVMNGPKARAR